MVTNLNVTKVAVAVHKLERKLNFKFECDIISSKVEKLVRNPSKIWKKRISGSSNFLWTWIEAGLLSVVKNSLLKDLEGKLGGSWNSKMLLMLLQFQGDHENKNKTRTVRFLSPAWQKEVTQTASKTFFTLFKLNSTFYLKCYLHHNCSINLNWNNTQLCSSAKPLHNARSSVFCLVNFCFLLFLRRTSVQKWKKNWFCYVHKRIGKKEILGKISKGLCWNPFLGVIAQIRAVYKDHKILITLKRCIVFKFLNLQQEISILWLSYLWKYFSFIWRQYK